MNLQFGDVRTKIGAHVGFILAAARNYVLVTLSLLFAAFAQPALAADKADGLRIATFQSDATPPMGYPMEYSVAQSVGAPLLAKGVVILGAGKPIVMVAVD